jgi:hypothetical protein
MGRARGSLRYLVALMLGLSLVVGSGTVATAATPTAEQSAVEAIQSLEPGEQLVLGNVLVVRTTAGLVVHLLDKNPGVQPPSTDDSFCGIALAAAIFGIGAGILGVIAASTGPGTVVIAGYLLTGAQVGVLAGISGSYAALLAWISRYVC